ncbi:MAG TPA: hypothetical protein VK586_09100 [Streptosporangiaceae bacterium]|nr:hypothetical protein [Streptosporangiaceae bacterium]
MAETQHPTSERPRLAPAGLRVMLATAGIVVGGAAAGIAGGLVWAAVAPRALFMVSAPGVAYVVNPETSAFIAADGWFSVVAAVGGVLIGVAGYLIGVRRYGPLPVAGVLAGATAAAFIAAWTGRQVGLDAFRHELGAAKAGALLRQPVVLGAHGALAFWPLAAGAAVGIIELIVALSDRRRQAAPDPADQVPLAAGPPGSRGQEADRDLR